jgi:hypothetical protein
MEVGPPRTAEEKAVWEQVCHFWKSSCEDASVGLRAALFELDLQIVWSALHCLVAEDVPISGFPLACISEELQKTVFLSFAPDDLVPSPSLIRLHEALGLRCTPLKLTRMVKVWDCNAMAHTQRKDTLALSVGFALMNHSCMPSVSWVFEGDEIVLSANVDLAPGDELSNSYIEDDHMHMPTPLRQAYIIETGKGFTCGCVRCSDSAEKCRQVVCPAAGCTGLVPLGGSASETGNCVACGRALETNEWVDHVARESELERLLEEFSTRNGKNESAESDSEGDSESEESEDAQLTEPAFRVEELKPEQLQWIRETATSGRWLAPAGHWLAHRAHGLLKDVAWSQKSCPTAILACLDQRAIFVRQAYNAVGRNFVPCPEHGWELLEAAELLLKCDSWPSEWSYCDRAAAAQTRLVECIEVLLPHPGPELRQAQQRLALLRKGGDATVCKKVAGVKRPRS